MDDNNLLMIILAFVFGFMLQGMMKNMCGGRLVEGYEDCKWWGDLACNTDKGIYCSSRKRCEKPV